MLRPFLVKGDEFHEHTGEEGVFNRQCTAVKLMVEDKPVGILS